MVQMDSEKHSRRTQKQEDFLSKLPDDVVGGILSRLPTKEAVRTSLLSKKWRYLWTLVYNLDFSVCTRSRSDGMACDSSSFRSFLYQVLRLLKSKNIGRFRLNWRGLERTDLLCANSCIQYAVDHNVAELDLLLSSGRRNLVHLPSSISTCRSLEVLNLGCDFVLNVPTTVECFVSLKILRVSAKLPDCESLSNLFCNCPVLEELSFVWQPKATDDAGMIFHISVPSLKKLAIERVVEEFELCSTDKFVIQTPKLESLQIIDESLSSFLMDEMPSLVEANVYFGVTMVKCQEIASYEASRAARIVRGIRMTKFLVLSDCTVACLSYAFKDNLPKFPFLVHLQLGIDSYFGWKLLPHFLESANELEVLVLVKESIWIYNDMLANDYDGEYVQEMDFYWIALKHVPHCLSYHVKEIKMVGLWGSEDEVEVVRYLLGNGKVLKKMSIEFSRDALKQELNERMITGFQRVSNECEIEFL